jgi:sensor histidine kinase regulating citrate/malate metabolism
LAAEVTAVTVAFSVDVVFVVVTGVQLLFGAILFWREARRREARDGPEEVAVAVRRKEMTLAGQALVLQLLIVLVVLVAVGAISLAQSSQEIQRVEGRESLGAAENLAAQGIVRDRVAVARPGRDRALAAAGEANRTVSGAAFVAIARPSRTVLSSSDPTLVGRQLPLGDSDVLSGRSWTGLVTRDGTTYVMAHVPVQDEKTGQMIGIVAIGRDFPSVWQRLERTIPNLLVYLGVASALGIAGSLLLARRVKRQTLGMEPTEIAGLVEHREAMLHGVKEGVVALDPHQRITVANDSAIWLLGLPMDCVGRHLDELEIDPQLRDVLTQSQPGPDRLVLVGERVLAFNRMPMRSRGRVIGSVTTLRDRTELSSLEKELGTTRATTDTLRAQTHEFANQLHTISGLLQLEEYDEVVRFVDGVRLNRTRLYDEVTTRVQDPTVAALVIAKASLAAERGVSLQLDPGSRTGRVDDDLSRDLTTVVGNLIDNALDAVGTSGQGTVRVRLDEDEQRMTVVVHDSGPGVAAERADLVFRQGYSTKTDSTGDGRGFGLALTRLVCRRRGGDVTVHNDQGAVFTAVLPKQVASPAAHQPARAGGGERP